MSYPLKSVGQKENLQKGSPLGMLPDNHKKPDVQSIGTEIKLQTEPSSVVYGSNTPNGTMQLIGDSQKLSHKPSSGYESGTPMSNRATESKGKF